MIKRIPYFRFAWGIIISCGLYKIHNSAAIQMTLIKIVMGFILNLVIKFLIEVYYSSFLPKYIWFQKLYNRVLLTIKVIKWLIILKSVKCKNTK